MIRSSVFSDELSLDFDETVRICAELRVPYIAPREGLYGSDINHLQMDGALKMKAAMDRYGIGVWAIGSQFGKCSLTDPADWEFHQDILERHLKFAKLWGSKVMRVFPMHIPDEYRKGEQWRTNRPPLEPYLPVIVERMRWACKRAAEEGVKLAIEPEGVTFSGNIPEIRAIIDAVGSDNLGVSWDVANSWGNGHIAWPDEYPMIRGLVWDIHVKDAVFDPKDRSRVTGRTHIDLGEIPWHDIFRQLLDDGYDGVASIETHLFFGMYPRHRWLQPATIDALRNLNRVLAEVQGVI
ncbi:MAG: sugar phosphate isomerase/epimerase [Chloroflexi bacterium]|nr:sugar phosphate isomerase/epimerase [Chloroflexota bacterium]